MDDPPAFQHTRVLVSAITEVPISQPPEIGAKCSNWVKRHSTSQYSFMDLKGRIFFISRLKGARKTRTISLTS